MFENFVNKGYNLDKGTIMAKQNVGNEGTTQVEVNVDDEGTTDMEGNMGEEGALRLKRIWVMRGPSMD